MKIVLATDGSKCSENAARFLINFNVLPEDEIIVLHVLKSPLSKSEKKSHYDSLKGLKEKIAPQILESAVEILEPSGAKITAEQAEGAPDKSIIEAAVNSSADMIVMGARGIKGFKSLFIGSVSRSVAINSPKPVLVTKPPQWEESGIMKVLFVTDGSDSAQATAELLASMPFPVDAELLIMNVSFSAVSDIPERFLMEISDKVKNDVAKARTIEFEESGKIINKVRTYLSKRFTKINALTKFGDPAMEILDQAHIFKADIIAVGSSGLDGTKGMLGSVARRILGHSQCAVLIGRKST